MFDKWTTQPSSGSGYEIPPQFGKNKRKNKKNVAKKKK